MTLAITKIADAHRQTEETQESTEKGPNELIETVNRILGKRNRPLR